MGILLGLGLLVALALLVSSRRLWAVRRHPVGAVMMTGGWVAVAVGVVLGPSFIPTVSAGALSGLVRESQIEVLSPLILFCLGWVGLMIGMQMHYSLVRMLPPAALRMTATDAALSLLALPLGLLILFQFTRPGAGGAAQVVIAGLLGACSVGWSAEMRSLRGEASAGHPAAILLRGVSGLASVIAVLGYGVIFKLIRHQSQIELSIEAAILGIAVSLLVALAMALMGLWLMRTAARRQAEFLVVLLGVVTFMAGSAAVLGYSPLFVSMLCGIVVVNMPGSVLERFKRVVIEAEQPVAMALMLVAGVLADLRLGVVGVVVLLAMLAIRVAIKGGVVRLQVQPFMQSRESTLLPLGPVRQSPLAIALAVGYAVSPHHQLTAGVLSGGQIITIVILVGLASDIAPMVSRWIATSHPQEQRA
jgi:hypothetical protein